MPGRLVSSPDNAEGAGHQMMFAEDRPVPATRKNLRGPPDVQNGRGVYGGRAERRGSDLPVREGPTQLTNGAGMTSSHKLTNPPYQTPGEQLKPAANHRPQSAMAFSSSSSSYNHSKTMYPGRPPSSLGVSWDPSLPASVVSGNMRNNSYGDGVKLGEGYSGLPHTSEKSEDVYASVARRHDRVPLVDTGLAYEKYSHRPQTQISSKYPASSGAARGESGAGRYHEQDNPAFVSDVRSGTSGEVVARPPSTNLELRSAWQRLYGNSLDPSISSQRPLLGNTVSSDKTRTFEDVPNTYSSRQQINQSPSPHLTQSHPHIHKSYPHEPVQSTAGNSSQNGRFTPRLNSPDVHTGNSSQNGGLNHYSLTSQDFTHGNSSQNGGLNHYSLTSQDFTHSNSSHNGRFTPQSLTVPDLQAGNSSQSGRFTPHLIGSELPPSSSSPDHRRPTVRESPTGQSSSNPDPTSGSNNSSQLSAYSGSTKTFSTFKPQKLEAGSDPTIGPSSKYPDIQMVTRASTQATHKAASHQRNRTLSSDTPADIRQNLLSSNILSQPTSTRRQNGSTSDAAAVGSKEDVARPLSRFSSALLVSDDSCEDEYSLQPHDSIFNYHEGGSEDGTVTPRASSQASQSPHATGGPSRRSENPTLVTATPGIPHRMSPAVTSPKTPDLLRKSPEARTNLQTPATTGRPRTGYTENKQKPQLGRALREGWRSADGQHDKARSKSLDDVRESEDDSLLSFDVENTILTVEPSDQSDRGTVRSHRGSNTVRAQLHRLEGMYSHVMKTLEGSSHGTRTRRRWSIGSSDTSSMRHHSHHSLHSRASGHRLAGREVKAIGKRFQRLESHVITLARSVAHLSSEMRVQNSLSREMENVKREIQELKSHGSASPVLPGNLVRSSRLMTDFERYQGWVPSLTNPRRVNKLTKFFGQEPPLLEIFLKQLGYEKFLQNFEQEHIGMIELPYMTEDKLQTLGIPMGPRLRILQEAQVYFKQANLDVYFV